MIARYLIPCLAAVTFFVHVPAEGGTPSHPPVTRVRSAIIEAVCYDIEVAEFSRDSLYASVDPEDARVFYAELLAQIPLADTPPAFAKAYLDHARAWKTHDEELIVSSWERIIQCAATHDVDVEKIQAATD